jgi:HEAT repeat protein
MREALPSLKEALVRAGSLPAEHVAAAAALARLGDASGVAALDRAAAQASSVLQVFALHGMAALAGGSTPLDQPETASIRARAVRSVAAAVGSPYEEVWSEAMRVLARTRPRGAVPVLEALERGEAEVALRARAARAAWGGPGAQEALLEALGSASHLLRAAACGTMGSLGDRSAVEHLARALSDPSSSVRVTAAWALAAVGGEKALKALERVSASEDVVLSNAARRALAFARARGGGGASRAPPRSRPARDGKAEKGAGLVLERIVTGTGGRLFCAIRARGGERRLLRRGEEADGGWRVEVIVPDGRGGGRVVFSRGKKTLDLRLGDAPSKR